MFDNLYHVIMAGGSGTRFWPVSRRDRPKQFLELVGRGAMIRQTSDRCAGSGPAERIFVSAGEEHRRPVMAALPELPPERFIGEPVARNTAPAVGLSALALSLIDPDAVAVHCPADHVYTDRPAYHEAIDAAVGAASAGDHLVTLGIAPARPDSGFGYIEGGDSTDRPGVRRVERFIEKPEIDRAGEMASSGRHFWNSGVFIWKVSSILAAIERHHPVLAEGLARIREAARAAAGERTIRDLFSLSGIKETVGEVFASQPSISIDYAVMEKAPNVLVVPCDPGWSDVGSWDAIAELGAADAGGNVLSGDVVLLDARDNFVRAGSRLIALAGVNDLIVVDTPDALLICRRGESQRVRDVVAALTKAGRADSV
jgi:mannose-1-phosphate guanylyltransferase